MFILLMTCDMYGNALMHSLKSPELHNEIRNTTAHFDDCLEGLQSKLVLQQLREILFYL